MMPETPAGFGPWEHVRERDHIRAMLDDLPTLRVDWTHGERHTTQFYVAHYPRPTR